MLFKAKQPIQTGLVGVEETGDNLIFKHVYQIEDALKRAYNLRQGDNNGWIDDRKHDHGLERHIGEIPSVFFAMHPEWNYDPNLIKKWLREDELGRQFKACSGGI